MQNFIKINSFCKTSYITNSLLLWQFFHIYEHFTHPWSVYDFAITVFTKVMMMQKENLVSSSHWYSRGAGGITCRAIILFAPTTPYPPTPLYIPSSIFDAPSIYLSTDSGSLRCHSVKSSRWNKHIQYGKPLFRFFLESILNHSHASDSILVDVEQKRFKKKWEI